MFNLEYHVPEDHLLRGIDRCLDLSDAGIWPTTIATRAAPRSIPS